MRNMMVQRAFLTGFAAAALLPVIAGAQRPAIPTGPARAGSTQPWQCTPRDSVRAFNRQLRADSLMRDRTSGGLPGVTVSGGTTRSRQFPEYDVVLDVPNLCVQRLFLKVDSLTAKLSLNARVANLVRIDAGADVLIGNVDLTIQGVRAQALLLVDLDDVVYIVDQTLTFVDNHPEIVQHLGSTLQTTVGAVGGLVNSLLLGTTRNALGQTVQRVIDQATGNIVERTLSTAGQMIAQKTVGSLLNLPAISNTTNAAGQAVRTVRDSSGSIIEFTRDAAGRILNSRIVQQATNR